MQLRKNGVLIHIDYCSFFSVRGWAVDRATGRFPANLSVHSSDSDPYYVSEKHRQFRPDVNAAIGKAKSTAHLGFSLNLLDVFNSRVSDYALHLAGEILWSFSQSLSALKAAPKPPAAWPCEHGMKQVLIVYDNRGRVGDAMRRLLFWQPHFFKKQFNSGVAYSALHIDDMKTMKESYLSDNRQRFVIVDESNYQKVFAAQPALMSQSTPLIFGDTVNLQDLRGGTLSVIADIFSFAHGDVAGTDVLMKTVCALSGYASLFFPDDNLLYTFQSGATGSDIYETVANRVQERVSADVVVVSRVPLRRLQDIRPEDCSVLVNVAAMKYCLDVMRAKTEDFVATAYRRGLRVRVVSTEET